MQPNESRSRGKGSLLWFLWGALMGFGLLGIFSIGLPVIAIGIFLLAALINTKQPGASMSLVGAAAPWLMFALEGFFSPDCASENITYGRGGPHSVCELMHSPSEMLPFVVISVVVALVGVGLFVHSLRDVTRVNQSTGP